MAQEANSTGCLKVLAIALPIMGLASFLVYKAMQASGRAAEVSERVVVPYLEKIREGQYQRALDAHGTPEFRKRVTADDLEKAYEGLSARYGQFVSAKLTLAQEQHAVGAQSIVQARYTLEFEKAEEHVTYDIVGEGDAARIDVAYERPAGREVLSPAPR
jgi:hypothetical protein